MDEQQTNQYLKGAVEALLLISEKPLELDQIKEAIETVEVGEIRKIIKDLQREYEDNVRGMILREIAGGFQMLSNPQYAEYVRNFFKKRVKEKLSRPGLETLAIMAYRQPVSRADVEVIRGVNSDGVVTNLLEKGLIKIVGRKDVAGRPFIYGTTKLFLEYFGLKSLKDLPKLEDVSSELMSLDSNQEEPSAGRGSGLFDSNKAESMEDAVANYGEGDHINRSFNSEEEFISADEDEDEKSNEEISEEAQEGNEEIIEKEMQGDVGLKMISDDVAENSLEADDIGNDSDADIDTDTDTISEAVEEPEDLKKVMEELSRDQSDEELAEYNVSDQPDGNKS